MIQGFMEHVRVHKSASAGKSADDLSDSEHHRPRCCDGTHLPPNVYVSILLEKRSHNFHVTTSDSSNQHSIPTLERQKTTVNS